MVEISAGRRTVWDVLCDIIWCCVRPAPYNNTLDTCGGEARVRTLSRLLPVSTRWNSTRERNKLGFRAHKPPGVPLLLEIVLVAMRAGFLFLD